MALISVWLGNADDDIEDVVVLEIRV